MLLILFDIDGTLLTSNGMGRISITEALGGVCGREISARGVSFSGRTDPAIVRDMLKSAAFSQAEIDELMSSCLESYASHLVEHLSPDDITLLPGISEVVHDLSHRSDIRLGLLTGNLELTALAKLRAGGLEEYFSFGAFGSDHEDRNELPPVAIARANSICDHDFSPHQTVIIGDTEHDISCSRASGVHAVAVSTGRIPHDTLESCEPDLLLKDLSDPGPLYEFFDGLR